MKNTKLKPYLLLGFFILPLALLFSQKNIIIQVLDYDTKSPLINAEYVYDHKKGTSDKRGVINIVYETKQNIYISHDEYEDKVITSKDVTNGYLTIFLDKLDKKKAEKSIPSVTIIHIKPSLNKEEIILEPSDYSIQDAGQLLTKIPEFSGIRKSGRYGFDPVLRGFKAEDLNIVVDGIQSSLSACPARMDPTTSHILSNLVDRIEVIKGPFSFRYGSSFGGTINYVSTPANFSYESELYGRLSSNYESNGDLFTTEALLGSKGKNHDVNIFGSLGTSNDYKDGNGNKVPSAFQKYSIGTNINVKLDSHQDLRVKFSRSYASDVDFPALGMDMRQDESWIFNTMHKIHLDKKYLKTWETSMSSVYVNHVMDNLLRNPRHMDMTTDAKTRSYGIRTEGLWKIGKSKLYTGVDFKFENAKGERTRMPLNGPFAGNIMTDNVWQDADIAKTGIFTEYQSYFKNFELLISGRLEWNVSHSGMPDEDFKEHYAGVMNDSQINPNLSLGITHNFSDKSSLGLWLGRSQRSGSIAERYINHFPIGVDPYEVIGNPRMKAEKNNQADLMFNLKKKNIQFTVDAFFSYIQDYITAEKRQDIPSKMPISPGVRQVINLKNAYKYGIEVNFEQKLPVGFSHQIGIAYTLGQDIESKEPLPEIAPLDFRYNLVKYFINSKLKTEFSLRHVIKQSRISESFGETKTPDFTLLDAYVSYSFTKKIQLGTGIKNLLDKAYHEHLTRSLITSNSSYILSPGRSLIVSLLITF